MSYALYNKFSKLTTIKWIVIITTLFIAFCGWSSIDLNISGWGSRPAFYIGLLLFVLIWISRQSIPNSPMRTTVIWTLASAGLSIIPALFKWDATIPSFIYNFITTYYGLAFYFLLSIWKVNPKDIIRILVIFCLIWVIIEIGQQFTYPMYWFLGRQNEWDTIEQRMGLWRFYIWGVDFVMMLATYFIGKLFDSDKETKRSFILGLVFSIGILCYCSRKHIICYFVMLIYALLQANNKHTKLIRCVVIIIATLLVYNFYAEFGAMNSEISDNQGKGEDFIRYLAGLYYLNDFTDSSLYPIFGTGWGSKILQARLVYSTNTLHFFRADIGIIGYYSTVGLVGTSAIIMYICKFIKNWKFIDLGYKLFFIMKILLIIFDFWMMWAIGIIAYGVFLYLLDLNIEKNKKIYKINYENRHINILQSR